jgi:hypothetical protein
MKQIILIVLIAFPIFGFTQTRKLKNPQPGVAQLMHFQIRLNPNDTIFDNVDFSYLPVKGFPFFTADYKVPFYSITQRDSIVKKVDLLFFEE